MASNDTVKKDMKIAALGGAGLPLSVVAREAGVSVGHAQYTLETKIERNPALGSIYDQFREEMRPVIQNIVRVALARLADRIGGKNVEIRDLVAVYNILSAHAGLGDPNNTGVTTTQRATVDTSNPDVLKAIRAHLVTERTEQNKQLAAREKT